MTDRNRIMVLSLLIPLLIPLTVTGVYAAAVSTDLHALLPMWTGWIVGAVIAAIFFRLRGE